MSEFNLIPQEYVERLAAARFVRWSLICGGLLFSACVVASVLVHVNTKSVRGEMEQLRVRNMLTEQQQAQLNLLQDEEKQLRRKYQVLTALHGGGAVEGVFVLIDQALAPTASSTTGGTPALGVWFDRVEFLRAGVVGDVEADAGEGRYLALPPESADESQPWMLETHVTIGGQAWDHSALSGFVRNLFEQPLVHDVRLQRTVLRRYTQKAVIDFQLAVVLREAQTDPLHVAAR